MKNKQALNYIIKKAKKFEYTDCQIAAFAYEVQEKIAEMPETDEEQLDELFEMWFQSMTEKQIETIIVEHKLFSEYVKARLLPCHLGAFHWFYPPSVRPERSKTSHQRRFRRH